MLIDLILGLALLAAPAPAPGTERRCGWLQNPTPANFWLIDRDGEWLIGAQGGYQAPGMDDMPDMSTRGWVETNGHYGYGCACMTVTTDRATRRVTRIVSARPVPLRQCRNDRRLPRL
ncbi:MAG TPA: DUF4087 domain-containing protein [Allosphingosinicella sp.]|nr:DUF4087 domain-containing protein [Allosphingosinicella sp.]